MARHLNPDPLGDEVAMAYVMTTAEQRQDSGRDWADGKRRLYRIFAKLLEVNPDGLLIASLLEIEHPSICLPNGRPRKRTYGELLELATRPVDNFVDNSPNNPQDAENEPKSLKTVDNQPESVDNPVDKMWITSWVFPNCFTFGENFTGFQSLFTNLSTGCG